MASTCNHCHAPAARRGLCWRHYMYVRRGTEDRPRGAFERVAAAALAYANADAEDDDAFRRARERLRDALDVWVDVRARTRGASGETATAG